MHKTHILTVALLLALAASVATAQPETGTAAGNSTPTPASTAATADLETATSGGTPASTRTATSGGPTSSSSPTQLATTETSAADTSGDTPAATATPEPTPVPTPRPGSQFAETDTPTRNVTAYDGPGERVDGGLVLLESSYENSTGQVSLTFEASEPTAVTLVDAGGFQEGGVLHQRHFIVDPGESTYQFPVTKIDGWVGVSITTDEVVYAEPIRVDDMTSVLDPPVESDLLALAVGISLPPMILWGYDAWKSRREGEGVTRIDGP